jgi:hypothetical protein
MGSRFVIGYYSAEGRRRGLLDAALALGTPRRPPFPSIVIGSVTVSELPLPAIARSPVRRTMPSLRVPAQRCFGLAAGHETAADGAAGLLVGEQGLPHAGHVFSPDQTVRTVSVDRVVIQWPPIWTPIAGANHPASLP